MTTTVLDELSINVFLSKGPFLNASNKNEVFASSNHFGVPYEMEMHSSINGFYRYGVISFFDDSGVRESLPLTGNEILTIMYKNSYRSDSVDTEPYFAHFNIFDIEEEAYDPNANTSKKFTTKIIKLHVIEAPFFLLYNRTLWQKAYGKDTGEDSTSEKIAINKIFEDHITKDLKIYDPNTNDNQFELNFSKMSTKMHFVIPSWKSQVTFTYLLDFCKDEFEYGNVKFYTTTNNAKGRIILNLKSLNEMFMSKNVVEFTHIDVTKHIDVKTDMNLINSKPLNQIIRHKFLYYDTTSLTSSFAGGYLLNYDYNNSTYFTLFDTYQNSNEKYEKYFSNYGLWHNDISNENNKQYYLGSFPKVEARKYLNNKVIKNKYQIRCEIITYVDEQLQIGDKILATFMSGIGEQTKDKTTHIFDEHMTDEWVIEEIIDSYRNGKAIRKMIIVKDSLFNIYGQTVGSESNKDVVPKVKYVNSNNG